MAVRDLRDVGVGGGQDAERPRRPHVGGRSAPPNWAGTVIASRPPAESVVDLRVRERAIPVACRGPGGEVLREVTGDRKRLRRGVDPWPRSQCSRCPDAGCGSAASSSRTSGSTFSPKYSISSWKCRKPPRIRSTPRRLVGDDALGDLLGRADQLGLEAVVVLDEILELRVRPHALAVGGGLRRPAARSPGSPPPPACSPSR